MSIVLRMLARRVTVLILVVATLFVVFASFAGTSRAEQLVASWYGLGDGFAGLTTANGETFDPYAYTAAHKTLPFNTKLEVTYGGESVVVRINDRGPYIQGRDIDLSYVAARETGLVAAGSAPVEVGYVDPSTPVGPVQAASSTPEPEPTETPSQQTAQERASEPEAGNEPTPVEDSASRPAQEEGVGLAQYPVEEQATGDQYASTDQYASADQYEEDQSVAASQYEDEVPTSNEPAAEPSAGPSAVAEFAPQPTEPEQPSPANVVPPVENLEEPPEVLVKEGSTVGHRVELNIAAAPGNATEAPDTPDLAPAPEEVFVSGEDLSEPTDSKGEVSKPSESSPVTEASEEEEHPATEVQPKADAPQDDESRQEVEIEVLPDTGGPVSLPKVSVADLVAVLLMATVLRAGLRRLQS